jgi:hypothetical protein
MPADELVAAWPRLIGHRQDHDDRRPAPRARELPGPRLCGYLHGAYRQAVQIAARLADPLTEVLDLPGEALNQGAPASAISEELAQPAAQDFGAQRAFQFVGDAFRLIVTEKGHHASVARGGGVRGPNVGRLRGVAQGEAGVASSSRENISRRWIRPAIRGRPL